MPVDSLSNDLAGNPEKSARRLHNKSAICPHSPVEGPCSGAFRCEQVRGKVRKANSKTSLYLCRQESGCSPARQISDTGGVRSAMFAPTTQCDFSTRKPGPENSLFIWGHLVGTRLVLALSRGCSEQCFARRRPIQELWLENCKKEAPS